jgi:hypothetical protein
VFATIVLTAMGRNGVAAAEKSGAGFSAQERHRRVFARAGSSCLTPGRAMPGRRVSRCARRKTLSRGASAPSDTQVDSIVVDTTAGSFGPFCHRTEAAHRSDLFIPLGPRLPPRA